MTIIEKPSTSNVPSVTDAGAEYDELLDRLTDGSIHRSFDPYRDIDWESPEFAVVENDRRWILPHIDPLGAHPWYQALPEDKQIAIGMYRQANVAKVGLQFEQILIGGFMQHISRLPNRSAEFRYATHEVIEECNHTLMFQELVNRTGTDVRGLGPFMRRIAPLLPIAARPFPSIFFMGVLAGEEPIDHIQKSYLRSDGDYHPTLEGVMRIHVAEEARHISFAHEFLRQRVPQHGPFARFVLSLVYPIVLRVLCNAIVVPPPEFWSEFDIPRSVKKDLFWRTKESRATLRSYFGDLRMLGEDIGLMNPVAKLLWKLLKIDGRASRFRSEPERTPARRAA
ncbi:diiron oxygenase [Aldersonia sp. NBC_00410]|uniref:AurF N-oxygenase family protein n=1 Tax=Aldersonia sp. NBC_00410 TaxID=2975954 RepID=UPI0022580098|nr:diiron oxygenase [Aldersonia sp. NBC_00410]MCX5043283.1 diiron oxygenase [Aldersonia sp. NBC_00410]